MDTETRTAFDEVRAELRADCEVLREKMRAVQSEAREAGGVWDRGLDARIQSHLSQAYTTLMFRALWAALGAFWIVMITLAIARAAYR